MGLDEELKEAVDSSIKVVGYTFTILEESNIIEKQSELALKSVNTFMDKGFSREDSILFTLKMFNSFKVIK